MIYHIGLPTRKRIKSQTTMTNIDFEEKKLSDSSWDYQKYEKRKNLILTSGSERKNFCFFMEDYLKIYE